MVLLVILCAYQLIRNLQLSSHQYTHWLTADTNLTVGGGADCVPLHRDLGEGLDTIGPGVGHSGFPHAINTDRL